MTTITLITQVQADDCFPVLTETYITYLDLPDDSHAAFSLALQAATQRGKEMFAEEYEIESTDAFVSLVFEGRCVPHAKFFSLE